MRAGWGLLFSCVLACGDRPSSTQTTGSVSAAPVQDDGRVACRRIKDESQCTVRGNLTPFVIRELEKNDVLSRSTLLLDASASNPESMAHLAELGGAVTSLEIETKEGAEIDLSALEKLPSLRRLRIKLAERYSFRSNAGLEVVSRLTGLSQLAMSGARLTSLKFMKRLAKLEKLTLSGGTLKSLDGLGEHPSLRALDLMSLTDSAAPQLEKLASLRALEELGLRTDGTQLDVGWVSKLESLTSLTVIAYRFAGSADASVFARAPKLEKLRIQGVKLSTLAPLGDAPALTSLFLEGTGGLNGLEALAKTASLRRLYIGASQLTDLSILESLTQLERLEIYSTKMLENLDSLAKLIHLKELGLYVYAKQSVAALPFIESLSELKRISIQGDYLSRPGREELRHRFPRLEQVENLGD